MALAELERRIRHDQILCVNIHFHGGFEVHVRRSDSDGFECAQQRHETLEAALNEHFGAVTSVLPAPSLDLDDTDDLLV